MQSTGSLATVDARSLKSGTTLSSDAIIASSARDIYYRKAKEYGFRARSAFKLIQCDESCDIFSNVKRAVDLCAAPGSWSQVLVRQLYEPNTNLRELAPENTRIVSVDLQEMAPIDGVRCIQGDITSRGTADTIISHFRGEPVDLVICDGAPDVTGMHEIDEYMQSQLLLAALNITAHLLRDGTGRFVAKIFKAEAYDLLSSQLRVFFHSVQCVKPASSRARSAEHFIVCKGFRKPQGYKAVFVDAVEQSANVQEQAEALQSNPINQLIMPYLKCGDLAPHDALKKTNPAEASSATAPSFTRFLDGLV